jgi:probable phosphoglycerate mutase
MLAERLKPWLDALDRPTVCVAHGGVLRAAFVLTGTLPPAEAAALTMWQDKVLRLRAGELEWL